MAHGFIATAVEHAELAYIPRSIGPKAAWDLLKKRHEREGPIRQVTLLHQALSIPFMDETPMPETATAICALINRAYTIGDVNKDVFCCIAMLGALKNFPNIQSIVSRDIGNTTVEKPYTSTDLRCFLDNEHTLKQSNKLMTGNSNANSPTALAAQTTTTQVKRERPICDNCKKPGHIGRWCAAKGGPFEKLGIAASIAERRKEREESGKGKPYNTPSGMSGTTNKVAVNVKGADGHVFVMMVDPANLTSPAIASTPEFTGIVSSPIPMAPHDEIEYGWLVMGEKCEASVDWKDHSQPVTLDVLAALAPLDQSCRSPISIDDHPFYVNTGATVHISPVKSDFLTLRPIPSHAIKGVGGSSITAIGMGDIKICIAHRAYITLRDALYIPNATVRLISVGTLAHDSGVVSHCDDKICWFTNKSTGALVARRSLLHNKHLFAPHLHSPSAAHVLNVTAASVTDFETWHHRLGHVNYQALIDMSRKGEITGMPVFSASLNPPKCVHCVLGKQTKTPVPKTR